MGKIINGVDHEVMKPGLDPKIRAYPGLNPRQRATMRVVTGYIVGETKAR
jgi:hypothetical protein